MRSIVVLSLLLLASIVSAAEPQIGWRETRRIPAAEAGQAGAADAKFWYAITNQTVAKYSRESGQLVAKSTGAAEHLNSGYFWQGKLYCAHSNFPQLPELSQIKVLDPKTMTLETCKDFGNFGGSLTWCLRRENHWWCNFAKYGDQNAETFLVKFDDHWKEVGRWTYPASVIKQLGGMSLSGGIWYGHQLIVSGHDDPVLFVLDLPAKGTVLEHVRTVGMPFTGQGFAYDPVTHGLIGIDRPKRELILAELDPSQPLRLRVMSYNIHHGEGTDGKVDLERIARVINSVEPDLVALQEVDEYVPRSNNMDQPFILGELTKKTGYFANNIPLQAGLYGNANLFPWKIYKIENSLLPIHENGEQRGVLMLGFKLTKKHEPFYFLNTHFDHRPKDAERIASAKFIAEMTKKHEDALMILAGDFNSVPESATQRELEKIWTRTNKEPLPTIPVEKPTKQLDYIFVKPANRFRIIKTEVLPEAVASDHRAIWAEVELLPAKSESE